MQRQPVESSNVQEIGYDPDAHVLEVLFKNDVLYRYHEVPANIHADLLAAPSAGGYLNTYIKRAYACKRVEESVEVTCVGTTPEQEAAFKAGLGRATTDAALIEALAHDLHEAARTGVFATSATGAEAGPVLPGWREISERMRASCRVQARYLLARYDLTPKGA